MSSAETLCPLTQKPCIEKCEWRMISAPYNCCIPLIAKNLEKIKETLK